MAAVAGPLDLLPGRSALVLRTRLAAQVAAGAPGDLTRYATNLLRVVKSTMESYQYGEDDSDFSGLVEKWWAMWTRALARWPSQAVAAAKGARPTLKSEVLDPVADVVAAPLAIAAAALAVLWWLDRR